MPLTPPFGCAAAGTACITGSSTGVEATMPRAASRIIWEAGRRVLDHQGLALVGVLAELAGEGHLGEQRHVELIGKQLAAALAEDRHALAIRAGEGRHVLDHAEHLQVDLRGHLRGTPGDALRRRLRGGDDHDLGLRQQLGERHGDVSRAGGRSSNR